MFRPVWKIWYRFKGWKLENEVPPDLDKFVIIAAPHTSNWDYPYTMAVASLLNLEFSYVAKDSLFKGKWGWFFRFTGGIPVDRSKRSDFVRQVADMIAERDRIALAIAPEGTRSKTDFWKSGFYHIAKTANVPIVPGYLDFANKTGGLGKPIWPIGTPEEVMDQLRDFYQASMAFKPEQFVEPRLKSESLPAERPEEIVEGEEERLPAAETA